ncbi:MAG: FxLYD domain-containing protein [Verrucomicrobiota bacterium]
MPSESFLKCPCIHCGGHIEFPTSGIGRSISCPHCGQQTDLVQAVEHLEVPTSRPETKTPIFAITLGIGVLLCAVVAGILLAIKQPEPTPQRLEVPPPKIQANDSSPKPSPVKRRKKAAKVSKATAAAVPGVDWNGLKASAVTVENSGGRLIYAVGTIRNESDRQRFAVNVSLDLYDAQEKKIGAATDYTPVIEPKKEWNFKALITDPKAVRAEITGIKEN